MPHSPRALLLDAYDESRETTELALRAAGFDVVACADEDEPSALSPSEPFDVAVLDLPLGETPFAARAIRAAAAARVIVALCSPTDSRAAREAAHTHGVDYFFLRPCPPLELSRKLRGMLGPACPTVPRPPG